MLTSQTKYRAARILKGDQIPSTLSFFGEYSFDTRFSLADAKARLFYIACQIGGMVYQTSKTTLEVYGCYEIGYMEFTWDDPTKGLSRSTYWLPIDE